MYDVLIAGYGPTGMLAAALLGRAGHRVGVFERYKTLYNLPRVGIVHDDVLRMFQEIGVSIAFGHRRISCRSSNSPTRAGYCCQATCRETRRTAGPNTP